MSLNLYLLDFQCNNIRYNSNCRLDSISQVLNEDSFSDIDRYTFLSYFQWCMTSAHINSDSDTWSATSSIDDNDDMMERKHGLQLKIVSANEAWIYIIYPTATDITVCSTDYNDRRALVNSTEVITTHEPTTPIDVIASPESATTHGPTTATDVITTHGPTIPTDVTTTSGSAITTEVVTTHGPTTATGMGILFGK